MRNFIQDGKTIKKTLAANISAGDPLLIGDILGIAVNDGLNGDVDHVFAIEGVFEVAKNSTDTFDPGQILFWDAGNSRLTETASTHKPVGVCMATAGNGATTCLIKLVPMTKDTDTVGGG